jgi:HEAT repeat protein
MAKSQRPKTKIYEELGMPSDVHNGIVDADPNVRLPIVRSLMDADHGMIPARFAEQLAREPRGELRRLFVQALPKWRTPQVTEALARALGDDLADVREDAARALGRSGDVGAAAVPALRSLLDDPVPAVRTAVFAALAALHDTETVDQRLAALHGKMPVEDRLAVVHAAGEWPDPTTAVLLTELAGDGSDGSGGTGGTGDSDEAVRALARRILDLHAAAMPGLRLSRTALAHLSEALADPTAPARAVVAAKLSRLSDPAVIPLFATVIRDPDQRIAQSALDYLRRVAGRVASTTDSAGADSAIAARRALVTGLADPHPAFRAAVLEAFADLDHPDIVDALIDALSETPPELSRELLSLLAERFRRTVGALDPAPSAPAEAGSAKAAAYTAEPVTPDRLDTADRISIAIVDYFIRHLDWFASTAGRLCMTRVLLFHTCTVRALPKLLTVVADHSLPVVQRELVSKPLRALAAPGTRDQPDLPVTDVMPEMLTAALRDPNLTATVHGISLRENLLSALSGLATPAADQALAEALDGTHLGPLELQSIAKRRSNAVLIDPLLRLLDDPARLRERGRAETYRHIIKALATHAPDDPRIVLSLYHFADRKDEPAVHELFERYRSLENTLS